MPVTNPYALILELPQEVLRPDHYELLGIAPFTADRDIIRHAAMDQNRKLMMWQNNDEYYPLVKQLMHDVALALAVLSNDETRKAYDRELRSERTPSDGIAPADEIARRDQDLFVEFAEAEAVEETILDLAEVGTMEDVVLEFDEVELEELEDEVVLEFEEVQEVKEPAASFESLFLKLIWGIPLVAVLFLFLPPLAVIVLVLVIGIPVMIGIKRTQAALRSFAERMDQMFSPAEFKARRLLRLARRHIQTKEPILALAYLKALLFELPETNATAAGLEEVDGLIALYRDWPIGKRAARLAMIYRRRQRR